MASESDLNSGTLGSSFVYLQVIRYDVTGRCTMGYMQTLPALSISDLLSLLDGPRLQCDCPVLPCPALHSIPFLHSATHLLSFLPFPQRNNILPPLQANPFPGHPWPILPTAREPASLTVWEGPSGPLAWWFLLSQHLSCSFTFLCLICTVLIIYL